MDRFEFHRWTIYNFDFTMDIYDIGMVGFTWRGFSMESFQYLFTNLKLAFAMVCLEYWAFEFLVGLIPDSQITNSLIAICENKEFIDYMITYGLSATASTRISNELGAGHHRRAKHAMRLTLSKRSLLQ